MSSTTLIQGGRVIDPSKGIDGVGDVLVENGKIASVAVKGRAARERSRAGVSAETIRAEGKIVCPGLIDMHVHLREPGNEDEETIASGSAAAVAGGFTSVACMPNTHPAIDTEAMIEFVYRQAARANLCNVYPVGAITKGREGKELAEMGQMVRAGAVAFSDDGCGVANPAVMYRAMQYAAMFDRAVIQHCEDLDLAAGGAMNNGLTATRLGLPGIPAIAEEIMIQRDLLLAREAGGRYHVAHISTARGVELVRQAKREGVSATTEVCPHHLLLTDEAVGEYDTNYKMNPPLRSAADIEACIAGVIDGTIDCLVTDHAPHAQEEKELDFQNAPFGVIGLESALPLFVKALLGPGKLDWPGLIARLTTHPARVLGIPKGTLAPGADADVTLIDPDQEYTIKTTDYYSKSRNCPYDGWPVKGRVVRTIVSGETKFVFQAGKSLLHGASR